MLLQRRGAWRRRQVWLIALVQAGVVAGLLVLLLLLALLWRSAPAADAIACIVRWRGDEDVVWGRLSEEERERVGRLG